MLKKTSDELWQAYFAARSVENRNELLISYAPLVKIIVNRLVSTQGKRSDYDDLINNGVIGLMDAIERFDPKRGVKFETYASLRIRGEIIDHMRRQDWAPVSLRKKIKAVSHALRDLEVKLHRDPTEEELASHLGMDVADLLRTLEASQSLNILYIEELTEGRDSGSSLLAGDGDEVTRNYEKQEMKQIIAGLIEGLPENERLVVTLYYYEELTMKEIALTLGVSEPRVSQIHSKVLSKLRARLA